jgi:hypothetical protein
MMIFCTITSYSYNLDYPPFNRKEKTVVAFQHYIREGKGSRIGFHHATLLGNLNGYPMWQWFSGFTGGIRFKKILHCPFQ